MKKVILATAIATLLVGCNRSSDENHQITEPKPEPAVPVINLISLQVLTLSE
ncbi:hypothetical protein JCM19239_7058 [Vibrio variabilis]|uniref:Uncharacterized protein n=1 Tax=Vibrio variabilis TaxID=990271 RepID=A0ABQ0JM25_9VIBR|nr:hypothetical protein JCM19239_7058 [Vibrio variabilis]